MSRLIDADALVNDLENSVDYYEEIEYGDVRQKIHEQPTVDAVEVVHARWLWTGYYGPHHMEIVQCSSCLGETEGAKDDKYCAKCGAKMDKRRESEESE